MKPGRSFHMRGFTLMELMIALTVTVILAGGTLTLVSQFVTTRERVTERLHDLERLQAVQERLRQDLEQYTPQRPVADEFSNPQPALISNDETLLELTLHGWPRSSIDPELRSDLQRVVYERVPISSERCRMGLTSEQWARRDQLEGDCLLRRFRQHLEAEAENPWREQVVMAPLRDISLSFIGLDADGDQNSFEQWPPSDVIAGELPGSLRAIEVTLDVAGYGPARFLWNVPGRVLEDSDEESL